MRNICRNRSRWMKLLEKLLEELFGIAGRIYQINHERITNRFTGIIRGGLNMRLIWSFRRDSPAVLMEKLPKRIRLPSIVTLTRDVRSAVKTFPKSF